uniref:Uncharacterized protein n=1 Tax=Alexandrium catenella TaxID=2925 RepID=A0A7S1S845_ALECA
MARVSAPSLLVVAWRTQFGRAMALRLVPLSLLIGAAVVADAVRSSSLSQSGGACPDESQRVQDCGEVLGPYGVKEGGDDYCPALVSTDGGNIQEKAALAKYSWGAGMSDDYFETFKGVMNTANDLEDGWCSVVQGTCFPALYKSCAKFYGCDLAGGAPPGLCDKVASKAWSMEEAAAQLYRHGQGKLWCLDEDIKAFCKA